MTHIAVSDESDANRECDDGDLPKGNLFFRSDSLSSAPRAIHTCPDADCISDVIGAMSEGCCAGRNDLDKRVEVFDLILIFWCLYGPQRVCTDTTSASKGSF